MQIWEQTATSRGSHLVVCGEICLSEAGVSSVTERLVERSRHHQITVDDLGRFTSRALPVDTSFVISSFLSLPIGRVRVAPDIFRAHVPLHLNSELLWARGADANIHWVIRKVWPSFGPH